MPRAKRPDSDAKPSHREFRNRCSGPDVIGDLWHGHALLAPVMHRVKVVNQFVVVHSRLGGTTMTYNLIRTFLAAVAVFFAVHANAAEGTESNEQTVSSTFPKTAPIEDRSGFRPHVGVKLGVASPEGSYNSAPEFGLDVGFQPYVPFGAGLAITTSRNTSQANAQDLERTSILARGTYNFGGSTPVIKNSWLGVAAGPVFRRDGTDFGAAPIVGFDIPMREAPGSYLSLGADAKYLFISGDEADTFSVNGVVKYWF